MLNLLDAAVRRYPCPQGGELRDRPRTACARPGAVRSRASSPSTSRRTPLLDNMIKNYDPYNVTETWQGDLAKAKAEMKLSKYDKNKDGVCDASACKNLFTITAQGGRRRRSCPSCAEPEGHRHHAQGAGPRRTRTRRSADAAEEPPVLDAPGLGQGLLRPLRVLRPALRRPQHHRGGQHQPRSSASRPRRPRSSASRAA